MATSSSGHASRPPRSPESYESLSRRNTAAEILQSYEKLSWFSFQRCESLAQTRLHFRNIVAGYSGEDEAALVDWEEDRSPRPKPSEEEKASRQGKGRVSTGGAEAVDSTAASSAQKGSGSKERSGSSASATASPKKKRRSGGGAR